MSSEPVAPADNAPRGVPLRLLVVEDSIDDAELLIAVLRRAGYEPEWTLVDSIAGVRAGLLAVPDVVISDYTLPGMTALDVLAIAAKTPDPPPVIVVSGAMDEESCVATIQHGAMDYLLKDRLTRLGRSVEAAMERHRLQREARTAREEGQVASSLLRGLVGNAPAAICLASTDGARLLSNPSFDRLPPLSPDPAGRVDVTVADHALVREEARGDRTYLAVHYPVTDSGGRTFALGSIHLDMTEQTRVMAELNEARAALQQRADALDARNSALQQLDTMKTQFVATVSHELRTPLTSICGYTELLREGALGDVPPMAADALDVIDRNGQRLLQLIDTLLLLSSVDDGSFAARREQVDVQNLLDGVVTALQPVAVAASVEVEIVAAESLPALVGDPEQLERLMFNLVSNAIKFSPDGGAVRVEAEPEAGGQGLVLRVVDQGIGIEAADMPKLFTRFHRAQSAYQNEIQGSGLGLAVSQEIARGHGGEITVQSALGEGSVFTVRLPISEVTVVDAKARTTASVPAPRTIGRSTAPRSPVTGRGR